MKVIASSAEVNWIGISLNFNKAGGNLLPFWSAKASKDTYIKSMSGSSPYDTNIGFSNVRLMSIYVELTDITAHDTKF